MTAAGGDLAARTDRFEPPAGFEPLAHVRPGDVVMATASSVLVGRGVAARLALPAGSAGAGGGGVAAALAAIPCEDGVRRPGSGPLAFGALPFDRRHPCELVVPRTVVVCGPDGCWLTSLSTAPVPPPSPDDALAAWLAPTGPPAGGTLPRSDGSAAATGAEFAAMVATAVDRIRHGHLAKVVLARGIDVELASPVVPARLLPRWLALEPACTVFAMPVDGGTFTGASPELLVSRRGDRVTSRPLAGTARGDGAAGLPASAKDVAEHRLVVDEIAAALGPVCTSLHVPASPALVRLHSVAHLGTSITGVLSGDRGRDGPADALDLVALLHPTPAVGGVPRAAALALIAELEPAGRGPYAGPVGWIDAGGDGDWVVGIRAAWTADGGRRARLVAGAGIVAASEPAAERRETDLKLDAVLDALSEPEPAGARSAG